MVLPDWTTFSLQQQIGQMVVVRASGYLFDRQIRYPAWEATNATLRRWLESLNIGGVILLGGSAAELALRSQQLQGWASTPLLLAADIEEGVGQRFAGAEWFPPPMALGAIASRDLALAQHYARQMGAITAQEALAIGINWVLAPIVDVNNNPDNPVINVRAFADTPEIVSQLATAFIQGAKSHPVLTTAKHFPGHGDTATDSHLDLPVLPHSASRLAAVELPPFQSAIAAGVDSIMSAHLLIPAWDAQRPATLSPAILSEHLRHQLGFEGLIVTDALIMGGVAQYAPPEEVAVMAVEAGADILLMPPDPEVAIASVYQAVRSGRLSEERIQESVARILQAKEKIFNSQDACENAQMRTKLSPRPRLPASAHPPSFPIPSLAQLAQPQSLSLVEAILRESMESGGRLPLEPLSGERGRNLIVVDDLLDCDFLDCQSPAIALPQLLGYDLQLRDRHTLSLKDEEVRPTLLQVFIRGNPFRGSARLSAIAQDFYQHLLNSGKVRGLMVYGSPYILQWFHPQIPAALPWIFSYGQMPIAQAIACQDLFPFFDQKS
jgi:beta-glucosidase